MEEQRAKLEQAMWAHVSKSNQVSDNAFSIVSDLADYLRREGLSKRTKQELTDDIIKLLAPECK